MNVIAGIMRTSYLADAGVNLAIGSDIAGGHLPGIYTQAARYRYMKPKDNAECKKVILRRDELDLQVKEIQKTYHEKFLKIIPATKVFDVINAEDNFHRQSLRWVGGRNPQPPGRNGQFPARPNTNSGRK